MPHFLRVTALALTLLSLSATGAQADTLSISFGADPIEEVLRPITASWSSSEPSVRVIVTSKPGSRGCGSTVDADLPYSTVVISRLDGSSGSVWRNWRLWDPGTITLCGYLRRESDRALLATAGPTLMTYRPARTSVGLEVPARVTPGQMFRFYVPLSAELKRHLAVTIKPAGVHDCGPSYPVDYPLSTTVLSTYTQGNHRYFKTIQAAGVNGLYLLCAYMGERPTDAVPEAMFRATFEVGPDLCAEARAKLTTAGRAARDAQSSVTRYRASLRRHERRARRTHGATRRMHRRLARRDRGRYESAVRSRDAARSAVDTARTEVTAACGGR